MFESGKQKAQHIIEEKEKGLEKVRIEVTKTKEELLEVKEELDQSQDINEKLIRDIQALNNKLNVLEELNKQEPA